MYLLFWVLGNTRTLKHNRTIKSAINHQKMVRYVDKQETHPLMVTRLLLV